METSTKHSDEEDSPNQSHFSDSISDTVPESSCYSSSADSGSILEVVNDKRDLSPVHGKKKKSRSGLDIADVGNSGKEVIRSKRDGDILQKKALVWTEVSSFGRSKQLKSKLIKSFIYIKIISLRKLKD